jgi:hypothetical protein
MNPSLSHIRRHGAVFAGLVVALAVWCAVDVSRRARIDLERPSRHMTDVTVYTEAGRAFFDGRDPYEVANIRGWKYLYPPLFALMIAPLSCLTTPWQASVWFAVSALMCFGSYFEIRRLVLFCRQAAGRGADSPFWRWTKMRTRIGSHGTSALPRWRFGLVWVAAGVTAILPALNCLQRGQMGIALLYPLLLGFRLIVTGMTPICWFAAGVVLALPIALKLTPALPVACLLFILFVAASDARQNLPGTPDSRWSRAMWPTAGCVAGSLFFLLLLPASLVGWDKNLAYLDTWYDKVVTKVNDVRTDDFAEKVDSPRNQSVSNAVFRFGNWVAFEIAGGPDDRVTGKANGLMPMDAPVVSHVLLGVRGLALLAVLGVAVRAGRSQSSLLWGAALGLACVATLIVSPVARGHYYVLFLPAAIFVPLWLLEQGKPREAFRAALVPAALVALHYVLLKYAGRIGVLGIGTTIWYFSVCVRLTFWQADSKSLAVNLPFRPLLPRRAA